MKKRIRELQRDEEFWFAGAWRFVIFIDGEHLWYGPRKGKRYQNMTIMKNSMMIVKLRDEQEKVQVKSEVIQRLEKPPAIYNNIKPKEPAIYY